MSCRQLEVGSRSPRRIRYSGKSVTGKFMESTRDGFSQLCCQAISRDASAFGEQQVPAILDRCLSNFGKSLQQPRQRDFQPNMIVRDIDMACRCLSQRADAKEHAIVLPSFLIDI